MKIKTISDPAASLLSIETCRGQLEIVTIDVDSDGIESHPDDSLILSMLDAAVRHAEEFTGRSISIRTYEQAADEFPDGDITIMRPPFINLLAFTTGLGSDQAELDATLYTVDDYGDIATLRPVTVWPTLTEEPNTLKIQFRAGYNSEGDPDTDAQTLPANIRAAILLMMAHLYESREDSVEKAMASIPNGFEALLRPMRVRLGMA